MSVRVNRSFTEGEKRAETGAMGRRPDFGARDAGWPEGEKAVRGRESGGDADLGRGVTELGSGAEVQGGERRVPGRVRTGLRREGCGEREGGAGDRGALRAGRVAAGEAPGEEGRGRE